MNGVRRGFFAILCSFSAAFVSSTGRAGAQTPDEAVAAPVEVQAAAVAEEEETGLGLEIGLGMVSRDLWRGFDLNHESASLQPWIYYEPAQLGWLVAELVFSTGLEEDGAAGDTETALDEIDFYLTLKHSLFTEKLVGSLILNNYFYTSDFYSGDGANHVDMELGASIAYEMHDLFRPYFAYYRGMFDAIQGNYLEAGVESTVPVVEEAMELQPKLTTGFFTNQYGIQDKFSQLQVELPVVFYLGDVTVYATPKYFYIPETAEMGVDNAHNFAVGVDVSYTF